MEQVAEDFYESHLRYDGAIWIWVLKSFVYSQFGKAKLISGDRVMFAYRKSKWTNKILDEYLHSIGCVRVTENPTKIVIPSVSVYIHRYYYCHSKPEEIDPAITTRHLTVNYEVFESGLLEFEQDKKTKIPFSESNYESIWSLMSSHEETNRKLAAMSILTMDWKGFELLLHVLPCVFTYEFRISYFSQIPGWSEFAKHWNFDWKRHDYSAREVLNLIRHYNDENQMKLLCKLLNNKIK